MAMPRAPAGHSQDLSEDFLVDGSVGIGRRNTADGDAAEDTVRLIGQTGGVEQRRDRLIRVTVSKYQGPQARDSEYHAIVDRQGTHRGCQRVSIGSENVDRPIAKIADQQVPFERAESGRCNSDPPGGIERACRGEATDEVTAEVE